MKTVGATMPDAVLLAGLTEENGAQLIKDKVAVLGPNNGMVKLLAPAAAGDDRDRGEDDPDLEAAITATTNAALRP